MKHNYLIQDRNNLTVSNNTGKQISNNITNRILQNKPSFTASQKELYRLRQKESRIHELSKLSKKLYTASIPLVLILTIFLELLDNNFNLYEYLLLNGIAMPFSVLINSFICSTSFERKRKLAIINTEIKNAENNFSYLHREKVNFKWNDDVKKYTIKPIDRTYEQVESKKLTKKRLNKGINI